MERFYYVLIFLIIPFFVTAQNSPDSAGLKITISSDDLSEDMSRLSSGNDELILIVYSKGAACCPEPLLQTEFVFDENIKLFDTTVNVQSNLPEDYIIFLIERDSRVSLKRIESVTRLFTPEIRALYNAKKTAKLEEYFGDDDLLVFCNPIFSDKKELSCIVSFSSNLDSYTYVVEVEQMR